MPVSTVAEVPISALPPDAVEPSHDTPETWEAARRELERRLVEELREAFPHAQPNYARPLDGRIVEYRATTPGAPARSVTDYELAGAVTFGIPADFVADRIAYGKRIRQVWSWVTSGVQLRFNSAYATHSHYGYQHRSTCRACGEGIWTNCDRPAQERCRKCRSTSGVCSETGRARSTAYVRHACRCDDCRRWNADRMQRHRKRPEPTTGARNNFLSPSTTDTESTPEYKKTRTLTKNVVTRRPDPETWTWLPIEMRAHIARHKAVVSEQQQPPQTRGLTSGSVGYWNANLDALERSIVRD